MTLYHVFETLLVPLIVIACALSVASRYLPRTRERVKASLATMLGGAMATGWRGWIARRLSPTAAAGCATGCDTNSGCSSCGSNTSSSKSSNMSSNTVPSSGGNDEQVIRFMRRP